MEDFAVMDPGVVDAEFVDDAPGESTALETTTDTDESTETPGEGEQPSTALALRPSELMAAPGKLADATKTALESIKAENPAIAGALQKVIQHFDAIRREFPGGMKELRQMRERLESLEDLSGEGGMETLRSELAGFREYDRQFMTADPAFVKTMLDAEPNAFQRLAPVIFNEFEKVNPEGYKTLIARGAVRDMMDSRLPVHMDMMAYQLTELSRELLAANSPLVSLVNRAIDTFNNGPFAYFTKIDAAAKSEIKMPEAQKPADEGLKAREAKLTKQEWAVDTGKSLAAIYREEFGKLAGNRKFSDAQKSNILELFSIKLEKALDNVEGYEERVNRYIATGDRQGNLRYQTSLYKQHAPRILGALLGPGKQQTVAGKPAARASENGAPVTPPVNNNGFLLVAKPPSAADVSPQTTTSMIENNRAILRDGRKVTWK